ncbi:hypothetical protein H4CHR_05070 [Variovorax sp. PBS-H4]|uniref:hypothetical protein n=1 Tax=Variovorax sp. PBS-H4 TaxID=434008 RepID=UPI0013164FEF|nr:hypothetical protein [Variovorax sp. PBS-H4]VTU40331.1 hypothetical protein H4CHR_05070 [Variovorax sp. PBS-H4]
MPVPELQRSVFVIPAAEFKGKRDHALVLNDAAWKIGDGGVAEEDRALLLGHAIEGMPQHYATATVERLVEAANKATNTFDRTTLLRVVNG